MTAQKTVVTVLCGFMAVCGSAAWVADPQVRLATYQKEVCGKTSGAYEVGEDLFVHVSLPKGKRYDPTRMKMKCTLAANDLLRKWAIDRTRTARESAQAKQLIAEGVRKLHEVLDDANPLWRFSDWNVKFSGQELAGTDKTNVWFVQIASIADVERQIPDSFKAAAPDAERSVSALRVLLPRMLNENLVRVYERCGTKDIAVGVRADTESNAQYEKISGEISEYLKDSARVGRMREAAGRLRTRLETESWSVGALSESAETNRVMSIQTNVFASCGVKTNRHEVVQSKEDRSQRGVSFGGVLQVEECSSVPEEEIVTHVVTITETHRRTRMRNVSRSWGNPRFEEVFLSGGVAKNEVRPQLKSGRDAATIYFRRESSLEEREKATHDALCENPGDVQMWNMYGRCLLTGGDVLGALICFRAAARLDPRDQYLLTNLAQAYERLDCHRVACGYAILGAGVAADGWCREKCREILVK